jgi:hypothetical protein
MKGPNSSFAKASDNLVGDVNSEIDTQCEGHIMESDNVSQFFTASELAD